MNGHPFTLARDVRLGTGRARRIAGMAANLSLAHAVGGATSCPMGDDATTLIAFAHSGRGSVDLRIRDGCSTVSNGKILTSAGPLAQFLFNDRLARRPVRRQSATLPTREWSDTNRVRRAGGRP